MGGKAKKKKITLSFKLLQGRIQFGFFSLKSLCVCVDHTHTDAVRGQKKASEALELELQVVVSHHVQCWELDPGPLQG